MRNFILAMIVSQSVRESRAMVLPEGALIHMVDEKVFNDYKEALGGVTPSNIGEVEDKLSKLGIDGRGQVLGKASGQSAGSSATKHK